MTKRITTSDVRELDRAMVLLQKGRISYGRWVETVAAWVNGEDVSRWDYGDAESLPERIVDAMRGAGPFATGHVAKIFGVDLTHASNSLRRLAMRGRVTRIRRGVWKVQR